MSGNVPEAAGGNALTIDELAARTGMTVRNLREWHGLGLIPDAEMRGRVGYYDESVVGRVESVRRLRGEGYTLPLIARMLAGAGDRADDVLELAGSMRAPYTAPVPAERLAEIAESMAAIGLSPERMEAAAAELAGHADRIAALFETIWMEHLWEPYLAAGSPGDGLPELRRKLERLQPMALDSVVAAFSEAMAARIERGIARELGAD